MTVKELKELLEEFDENLHVQIKDLECYYGDITEVREFQGRVILD